MENTWVIAKNGYGYHDVNADDTVQTQTSNKDKSTGSNVKKTSTVKKQFVVDFTSDTYRPLQEHELNGLDYRYVYSDKARLSAVVVVYRMVQHHFLMKTESFMRIIISTISELQTI